MDCKKTQPQYDTLDDVTCLTFKKFDVNLSLIDFDRSKTYRDIQINEKVAKILEEYDLHNSFCELYKMHDLVAEWYIPTEVAFKLKIALEG